MLNFRLFDIPIGVHATFLFIALLGAASYRGWDIAIWTVAAFVSILLHELGHALVATRFGAKGVNIYLYGLGGVTSYTHDSAISHGRSFLISAAGSTVGILLGGLMWIARDLGTFDGIGSGAGVFINSFIFTALIWGALNWIPIVPLDGGHMVQHLAAMFNEDKAPLIGQVVTWAAVAIVVPYAWVNGYRFAVFIVVMFAFNGLREYRATMARRKARSRPPQDPRPVPPADPTPPQPPPEFPI